MKQQVWREGDRIRRSDGTGYGDMVSDDYIRQHIDSAMDDMRRAQSAMDFGRAVLALREEERAALGDAP